MKKKSIIVISIILVLVIGVFIIFKDQIFENKNFIKLSYNEILEKLENKDTFVLCVSRKNCSHCKNYKPKLINIIENYNIIIYYTNVNEYTDEDYETFKKDFSFDGGTPTTILFKNGEETTTATRLEGDISEEKVISKLKQNGFIK